jgi:two-component system OmpR family sensor kinase
MIPRRLSRLGLGFFVGGVLLAILLRLAYPLTILDFGFYFDPATLALLICLLIALILLGASLFIRRQELETKKALDAQADSLEEEHRRFIQRLDHEMKNPLTAIKVQLDNLQESTTGSLPVITDVRAQADRLVLLTRGLRSLADLETRPLEMEPVDIDELLQEVVDFLEATERINLDIQRLPWTIPPIKGDRELLLMAFRNLVENALNYSVDSIEVRARHTSGHLIVEVIDTGRGIPSEDLPLVTEELYRGSNVHEVDGSGLGLSIVKRIILRHGGRLELRSRSGQGTIASVQLPYEQAENY